MVQDFYLERKQYKTAIVFKIKKNPVGLCLFLNSPTMEDYFCLSSTPFIVVAHQSHIFLEKVIDKVDGKGWESWFQKNPPFLWQPGK